MATSTKWWIRPDGRVRGPLSPQELRELAALGAVHSETPVSPDGHRWRSAAELRGLDVGPAEEDAAIPGDRPHETPPPPRSSDDSAAWVAGSVIAVVVLVVLFVGGIVLAISLPDGSSAALSDEELVAQATYEFWLQLCDLLAAPTTKWPDAEAAASYAEGVASQIDALPTVGVDLDAVDCGLSIAEMLRDVAARARRLNDPALVVESMFRGMAGDPFGTVNDELQANRYLLQEVEAVQEQCRTTRAVLTARYGVEFPQIPL